MFLPSNRKFFRVESNSVYNHTDDREPGSDLFILSMIRDRIGRHKVLLPVNQKYDRISDRKTSVIRFYRKNNN